MLKKAMMDEGGLMKFQAPNKKYPPIMKIDRTSNILQNIAK